MPTQEYVQGYSENGLPSYPLSVKEIRDGQLHGVSHVWIWRILNNEVQVLLQLRNGTTWPGYWDISTAGHIDAGEEPLAAAIREASEEIGINLRASDLSLVGVYRWYQVAVTKPTSGMIIENEFQWVYTYKLNDATTATFSYQESEVESTLWISLDDLIDLVAGKRPDIGIIIDHDDAYYQALFRHIHTQLDKTTQ